jgi:hypothetical protein
MPRVEIGKRAGYEQDALRCCEAWKVSARPNIRIDVGRKELCGD